MRLTINDVREMLAYNLAGDDSLIFSNAINRDSDTSIGIFSAPETRSQKIDTYGVESTVCVLPVNILVHWTDDSDVCEMRANEVYDAFKNLGQNFLSRANDYSSARVAFVTMLDDHPIWLGRDDKNICEYSIRVNIIYYKE